MGISMIVFSLILLMFFAYRGYSIIFIAPIFAVVAAIGSGHASMPVYSEIYMTKAAEYIKTYYPVFLLGAVFAKIMEQGGSRRPWPTRSSRRWAETRPFWPYCSDAAS